MWRHSNGNENLIFSIRSNWKNDIPDIKILSLFFEYLSYTLRVVAGSSETGPTIAIVNADGVDHTLSLLAASISSTTFKNKQGTPILQA
ncbi:hypothetical protein SAMN05216365_10465 [Porphyromonadaceae bacterium NLAE-zl-C104]|nr:hypothetical protein SAMN05216331_10331 [Porphyromonadaceae bacterium KH3R12]SFS39036.1 hypothetical protein SAMN05216365_10465 [Porphyromonadaceae bacterium NLAE-zl-C104]